MKAIVIDKNGIGYYLEDTIEDDDGVRHRVWGKDMVDAMLFEDEREAQAIIDAFLERTNAYIIDVLDDENDIMVERVD